MQITFILWLNAAKIRVTSIKLQIKVVLNWILYKKVPERVCLSPRMVEVGGSKDWYGWNIILYWKGKGELFVEGDHCCKLPSTPAAVFVVLSVFFIYHCFLWFDRYFGHYWRSLFHVVVVWGGGNMYNLDEMEREMIFYKTMKKFFSNLFSTWEKYIWEILHQCNMQHAICNTQYAIRN